MWTALRLVGQGDSCRRNLLDPAKRLGPGVRLRSELRTGCLLPSPVGVPRPGTVTGTRNSTTSRTLGAGGHLGSWIGDVER